MNEFMRKHYEVEKVWMHRDLRCVVVAIDLGHRCGYVGVPEGHPLFGLGYSDPVPGKTREDLEEMEIGKRGILSLILNAGSNGEGVPLELYFDVHGSLTFARKGEGYPIESDDPVWWFGFDCGHAGDARDMRIIEQLRGPEEAKKLACFMGFFEGEVRNLEYVASECERLADQLADFIIRS